MKKKNIIIVFVMIICFIILSFIFIDKKYIKTNDMIKYATATNLTTIKTNECDRYFADELPNGMVTGIISGDDKANGEGYPWYIVNKCMVTLEDYLAFVDDEEDENACNIQRDYVQTNASFVDTEVNYYNKQCEGVTERLEIQPNPVEKKFGNCSTLKDLIETKYASYYPYTSEYNDLCESKSGILNININKNSFFRDGSSCENFKLNDLYSGKIGPGENHNGYVNECGYALFFYNGYATSLEDYTNKYNVPPISDPNDISKKMNINDWQTIVKDTCVYYYDTNSNNGAVDYYNANCASKGITESKPYKSCDISESSVGPLSIEGVNYTYFYDKGAANYVDNLCMSNALDAILIKAKENGQLDYACNYFKNLYDEGLLDFNDINVLRGTHPDALSNTPKCLNSSFNSTYTTCQTKTLGGMTYYIGLNNERIDKCDAEIDIGKCSNVYYVSSGIFNSSIPEDRYANGMIYQIGYVPRYYQDKITKPNYYYPAFVVNGCKSFWAITDIVTKIDKGCEWFSNLANKGLITEQQYNEAASVCPGLTVNTSLGACHKDGNSYSENGFWVSEEQYNVDCNSNKIFFNENGGYGLDCGTNTQWSATGVCQKTVIKGTSTLVGLPNTDTLYKGVTTNKFKGWSLDSTCNTHDLVTNSITVDGNSSKTYYACYDNNDVNYGTDTTLIYDKCDYKTTTLTSRIINNTEQTVNTYCKINCKEKLEYTYPSIFQTVKSGTYFEFMYNPEVKGTMTCRLSYDYNAWKTAYNTAIENEKDAYNTYMAINDTLYSIKNPTTTTGKCNCDIYGNNCSTYYESRYTRYFYNISSNNTSSSIHKKTSCGAPPNFNYEISIYENNLDNAIKSLKSSIDDRRKLEMDNRDCYWALDNTSESSSIKKDDISIIKKNSQNGLSEKQLSDNNSKESAITGVSVVSSYNPSSSSGVVPDEFYDYTSTNAPDITFNYGDGDSEKTDELEVTTKILVKDTGAYSFTDGTADSEKKSGYEDLSVTVGDETVTFKAYNFGYLERQSIKYYEYSPSKDYYVSNSDGSYSETNCSNCTLIGKKYPVLLSTSGKKDVSFVLSGEHLGHKNSMSSYKNTEFECQYNVTNDIIIPDKDTVDLTDDDIKYKANFYVRNVATSNVDPNNRKLKGTLGANWASKKGQDLIDIIEAKANGNNTYNPDYLEYSFTLTPSSLREIIDYNKNNKYSDFNLECECNNNGGECKSTFLTNYSKGKVGTVSVNNGNSMSESELNNKRKEWKYYINGSWVDDRLYGANALEEYKADYAMWGVLP